MLEQHISINIPLERQSWQPAPSPQSDISDIRDMFSEMNKLYMIYEPAPYYFSLKRIMDIVGSTLFIILVVPIVFPIIALLIKITSKGPVFFIQKRTGYKGVEFDCYKFRTMYINDDANTRQASSNDKRITPIGKFLRFTHFDEMPQFFNVFLGDMSIVGPRPHMLYHTSYYAQSIPYYNLRHEAQPGLTGMAQIKGYIGEISIERELRKRIQWDIYYLKNRSTWLDTKIFLKTVGHVFLKMINISLWKKDHKEIS